ncbi:type II toxin-antitoxin system death-on-curing family toxin [Mycobacterium sp.]|uniref:type II toxin-antitoxin system death-on-curing family toxin n=1 Tax=Mycobacterium sp. TaxID=1785 RepID=UPI003F9545E6
MTTYLRTDEILDINRNFEGPDQLRDFGLLDGAVMRPQASAFGEDAFPTIHEKAAALLHGLARSHPFINGNKRTAWTATSMFYMVNGYNLHVEAIDIISLTTDAAEGQIDVQDIAATLKDWAQPFPTADDWMDTPPDVSAGCRERPEDYTTDVEENIEAQIAEFEQNLETQVGKWAEEWKQDALRSDRNLRIAWAELQENLHELAEMRRRLEATAYPLSIEAYEGLRRARQNMLDMAIALELPPEWVESVNAHPAFAGLGGDTERKSRGPQQRKSPGAQQRKARAAQRRKRRRR